MQISELIGVLLKNRGLTEPEKIADFFVPPKPQDMPVGVLGWSDSQITSALNLIKQHIASGSRIAIYGDYDVDGITSTAILWETIFRYSKSCFPYIPHRRREGYGLTKTGIDNCLKEGAKLIIVVDSGITASVEIDYCRSQGCDIVIIDHHQPPEILPKPTVLLFSTVTSAAGLSWFFAREILAAHHEKPDVYADLLSLCAISVICDLVPLLNVNRSLAKYGLEALNSTSRPGLLSLFAKAGIAPGRIGVYEVGFAIGPRINAMGRLEHALDSLRLICTKDLTRAADLARLLDDTNRLRQEKTDASVKRAISAFQKTDLPEIILISDTGYDEGVIGLIAAKLVEEFYRPSLVISVGDKISKGSGRSVAGFHITDFLRRHSNFLKSVGGHEMAAGFSLLTADLENFSLEISQAAAEFDPDKYIRTRRIEADIPLELVNEKLHQELEKFSPFGLGNPRPVFSSHNVTLTNQRWIGRGSNHLKFTVSGIDAIYFQAPLSLNLTRPVSQLVYSLNQNTFNGISRLQLLVKQIYDKTA